MWNSVSGKILQTYQSDSAAAEGGFSSVGLSAGGQVITAAGRLLQIWDGQQGNELGRFFADAAIPSRLPCFTYHVGENDRLTVVSGHGHAASFTLPVLAKDRAKQRGISMFGPLGGVS